MVITVENAVSLVSSRTAGQNVTASKEPETTMATRIKSHWSHSKGMIHSTWGGQEVGHLAAAVINLRHSATVAPM